jgi:acetylornithine deacetylase/succinyl-diaminopimelate desuccinylase-like protein
MSDPRPAGGKQEAQRDSARLSDIGRAGEGEAPADDAAALLRELIAFDTVNPPGNERPAQERLAALLGAAGFQCELLGAEPGRPNLIARLPGAAPGPRLCYLAHVDTVLADPAEWRHDPWSGDLADGFIWGRGAIDMKSQLAAEVAAAVALARSGWRPARGELLVLSVVDEETGGALGAGWLTREHPEKVRCDLLLNEGGGAHFAYGGQRYYGVCCAEKGVFRFTLATAGVAGHASMPGVGENALLKMGPLLERLAARQPAYTLTDAPAAFLRGIGEDPQDPAGALARLAAADPRLATMFAPMFGVTFTPTRIRASEKINVIPSRAELKVDCRVPPGLGEPHVRAGIAEVLGGDGAQAEVGASGGVGAGAGTGDARGGDAARAGTRDAGGDGGSPAFEVEFTERVMGNGSPIDTPLMGTIGDWIAARDPGARVVPVILPGFTDSRHFRAAFPECVAYGFFPHRHQSLLETSPLMHARDERIDVRDLAFATEFFADLARSVLG